MTETTETITETTQFPIFKGAVYNISPSANTTFFTTDLVPTNTPTTFRIYYVGGSTTSYMTLQRTNGTNVLQESIYYAQYPTTYSINDIIVGPNDTINFLFTSNGQSVKTLIVIEVDTNKGPNQAIHS